MDRQIWLFGNPDKSKLGFRLPGDMVDYIRRDIFDTEHGRYRYTQIRDADIIVLSRDGLAYGHFEIDERVSPNDDDRAQYPAVKQVYVVRRAVLYRHPVQLSDLDISRFRWGYRLTEDQFRRIERLGQTAAVTIDDRFSTDSTIRQERVLREVRQRLGQSDFRRKLLQCYDSRCAVTNCDAQPALEAAHIHPYSGRRSNHPSNGLLLRSDIHALFDLDLVAIHPTSFVIALAESLVKSSYSHLQGAVLRLPARASWRPDHEGLKWRWQRFAQGCPVRDNDIWRGAMTTGAIRSTPRGTRTAEV